MFDPAFWLLSLLVVVAVVVEYKLIVKYLKMKG